ncbi:MAG TPA: peptidoglycan-binding protein [Azospirillum sp.]|nr:peptidoglycan-binding protein [Azospirillum sp.]
MAKASRRSHPRLVLGLLGGLAAGVPAAGPALAQQAADVQWVQMFLKEKGFDIGGRANGQMTQQTRNALSAWQKSVGLPATGNLDAATTSKIMAERSAKTAGTMHNLAQQKVGGGGPGQEKPQREVAPRAAQRSGSVDNVGGGEVALLGPVVRSVPSGATPPGPAPGVSASTQAPTRTASPAHADGTAPQAAPRASVTATTADGTVVPTDTLSRGDGGFSIPGWLRYAVMAVLAGTLGFIGLGWWRSGRPKAPPARAEAHDDVRREPSFGSRREELTAGPLPRLSGERRGR